MDKLYMNKLEVKRKFRFSFKYQLHLCNSPAYNDLILSLHFSESERNS